MLVLQLTEYNEVVLEWPDGRTAVLRAGDRPGEPPRCRVAIHAPRECAISRRRRGRDRMGDDVAGAETVVR